MAGEQGRGGRIALVGLSLVAGLAVAAFAVKRSDTAAPRAEADKVTLAAEPGGPAGPRGAEAPVAAAEPEHAREERVIEEMKNVPITIYSAAYCPWCKKAKAWMDGSGMAYTERRVDLDAQAKADMKRLGRGEGIPTFDIEGDVHSGYDPAWVEGTLRTHAERRVASR